MLSNQEKGNYEQEALNERMPAYKPLVEVHIR
jgi:hypothetical protein